MTEIVPMSIPFIPYRFRVQLLRWFPLLLLATLIFLPTSLAWAAQAQSADVAATNTARVAGGTIPLDSQSVHPVLQDLTAVPKEHYEEVGLLEAVRQHPLVSLIIISMLLALAAVTVVNRRLARRVSAQAKVTLTESHRRLSALMGNLPGMTYRCRNDPNWTMEFLSEGCLTLTGRPAADLLDNQSISYAELIHPDDRERVWNEVQAGLLAGKHFELDYRLITAAGAEKWVWEHGTAVCGDDEKVCALEGVILDNDARKRAEVALQESESRFRAFFDHAGVGIAEIDTASSRFLRVNQWYCEIVGYPSDEMHQLDFQAITHPDDLQLDLNNLTRLVSGEIRSFSLEKRFCRKDGRLIWVDLTVTPLWDPGELPTHHIAVVENIDARKRTEASEDVAKAETERLLDKADKSRRALLSVLEDERVAQTALGESEKRFRNLFEHAEVSIWQEDLTSVIKELQRLRAAGVQELRRYLADNTPVVRDMASKVKVIHVNQATLKMFEATAEDEFLSRIQNAFGADAMDVFIKELCAIWDGKRIFRAEAALRTLKGREITGIISFRIPEKTEEFASIPVSILDITEHKLTEQALRRAQKMDAIGQLTGGIAHDFNNILGIILGNLTFLQPQVAGDDEAKKRVETIRKSAQRAADLTRQLLGFSRRQSTQAIVTDLNRVIADMESLFARSVTPLVTLEQHFADDLWLTEIDPGDFADALLNLVLNARDAMPRGGRLTLETSNRTFDADYCANNPGIQPGNYVQLIVSDTGEGIPAEHQERIYEPFFTTKAEGKGTGLGLSMVYGFVKRSKGAIKVYSELGIGTTFRLYLPQAKGEDQSVASSDERLETAPRGHETILVVDDEEELLELAQASLQALGYRVLTATNGPQALDYLAQDPAIDLLFSDVVMPGGVNGYELATRATASHPKIKVLLTSGFTEKALTYNGQSRFAVDLLSKPYSQTELIQRVRVLLGDKERQPPAQYSDPDTSGRQPSAQPPVTAIKWTDDLSVGVDALDKDHRALLEILNRSLTAAATGDEKACTSLLDQLCDYTKFHFRREETVLEACGYRGLDNHRQVHQLLARQVDRMRSRFRAGDLSTADLVAFLNSWLVDHIRGLDRAFAPHCLGKAEIIKQALERTDLTQGPKEPL